MTAFVLSACERPTDLQPVTNAATAVATANANAPMMRTAQPQPAEPERSFVGVLEPGDEPQPAASTSSARTAPLPQCGLPAVRPPQFRVRIEHHALPIRGDASKTGSEVHATGAKCPLVGDAADNPPCKALSPAALDRLYAIVRASAPCTIEEPDPPQRSSPHYGRRHILITVPNMQIMLSDSSSNPLRGDSLERFRAIYDAVVTEVNATP
jgi:hypothetical protein